MSVVDAAFGHPLKLEEEAAAFLAGGIAANGYQCGMLWGAALAAGAQAHRLFGPGAQAEAWAILTTQRLVEAFRAHTKNEINCLEITHLDLQGKTQVTPILKFFIKGGPIFCLRLSADYARDAFSEINRAATEMHIAPPAPPASCAALLAQKMGESDLHTAMAAGLAGGIGLSGGACGALGAAIWINAMKDGKEATDSKLSTPKIDETIEKFLEISDYEFECAAIAGRKFENVDEHAGYLRQGGCAKIIEALAATAAV